MKQVFRRVIDGKGRVVVEEVPAPAFGPSEILVANRYSLISSGTELSTVRKTPMELGRQVLSDPWMRNAVKKAVFSGGLASTLNLVSQELTMLRALGYSSAGTVLARGDRIGDVEVGDRVACAGTNYANHADLIRVPQNLYVKVPETVDLRDAAFIRVAAIGLHGLRRARLELGEKVGIVGLGLLGQLTAQIALAAGMDVYGLDINPERLQLAGRAGVPHCVSPAGGRHVETILQLTGGRGLDAVVICASSGDRAVANDAMKMCRKQGRVVAVGIVKMDLERMPFFVNELDFRFSRGHGPGSRDESYEVKGIDYPYGYVRWTEKRNMEEVARLMALGKIRLDGLVGEVVPVDEAPQAYQKLSEGTLKGVAALIEFKAPAPGLVSQRVVLPAGKTAVSDPSRIGLGLIGCGNFMRSTLLPCIGRVPELRIVTIASATGVNARSVAGRYGVQSLVTDNQAVFDDPGVEAVVIATRHNQHAALAQQAARAGKHVFMEKPMALDLDQYRAVIQAARKGNVRLMVGYNRRYSPLAVRLKEMLPSSAPVMIQYLVNVGRIPAEHWTLDPVEGGGRLLGEADHFFDLFCYWTGALPKTVYARCITGPGQTLETQYDFCVHVQFDNGSIATLTYTGLGSAAYPKETAHVMGGGMVAVLSDYKTLEVVSARRKKFRGGGDKGHQNEMRHFARWLRSDAPWEAPQAPLCALAALESLRTGSPVALSLSPEALAGTTPLLTPL